MGAARFFKLMGAGRGCLPKLRGRRERLPFFDFEEKAWLRLVRLTPLGLTAAILEALGVAATAAVAAEEEGANVKGRAASSEERRRVVETPKRERTTREKPENVESLRLFWCEMEVRLMVEFLMPPLWVLPEEEASTTMAWSPSWRSAARALWWWWVAMCARRATEEDERVIGRAVCVRLRSAFVRLGWCTDGDSPSTCEAKRVAEATRATVRDEVEACIVEFGGGRVRSEEKEIKSKSLGHVGVYSLSKQPSPVCEYRVPSLASEARWLVGERDGGTRVMSQPVGRFSRSVQSSVA